MFIGKCVAMHKVGYNGNEIWKMIYESHIYMCHCCSLSSSLVSLSVDLSLSLSFSASPLFEQFFFFLCVIEWLIFFIPKQLTKWLSVCL